MELTRVGTVPACARKAAPIYVQRGSVTEGDFLVQMLRKHASSCHVLITDRRVHRLYGHALAQRLRAAGIDLMVCRVPAKESSKSPDMYLRLVDRTLRARVDKRSHVLTLGGGVVSNLGGFVAATVFRGLPLVHLPSTVMAQLDAAIDVRQAINHTSGKNLVGALYAPAAIIIDSALLATLPLRHVRSGLAEAIKHALTQSRAFWQHLMENSGNVHDVEFLERVVRETIRRKLALLARPTAAGAEFHLQYGHCIGHAIEAASQYRYAHGEAIAIGMTLSAEIGLDMGICGADLVNEHRSIFRAYGLPSRLRHDDDIDAIVSKAAQDKNVSSRTPRIAVLRRIGRVYQSAAGAFVSVPLSLLRRHLLANRRRSA